MALALPRLAVRRSEAIALPDRLYASEVVLIHAERFAHAWPQRQQDAARSLGSGARVNATELGTVLVSAALGANRQTGWIVCTAKPNGEVWLRARFAAPEPEPDPETLEAHLLEVLRRHGGTRHTLRLDRWWSCLILENVSASGVLQRVQQGMMDRGLVTERSAWARSATVGLTPHARKLADVLEVDRVQHGLLEMGRICPGFWWTYQEAAQRALLLSGWGQAPR